MLVVIALTAALAAPDGYRSTKEGVSGCNLFLGPANEAGILPMRAECHWPDVTVAKFDSFFANWGDHDLYFQSIDKSDVLSTQGAVTTTAQTHVTKGISNRFVVLDGTRSALADGGFKYSWTKSAHTMTVPADAVEVPFDNGYWEVHPASDGGVDVTHELVYDPGGSVPGFIVRWFQTSGLADVVTDLHTWMTTH